MSLNDCCARKLAVPVGNLAGLTGLKGASQAVERAAGLFCDRLIGIAAFGSWARGEATPRSDVDILVVLDSGVTQS